MANRFIGDNIRLVYDLISYLERENLPGLFLCLDFEKNLDSVGILWYVSVDIYVL